MRRVVAAVGSLAVVAMVGYGAADVYDIVPGILTRERPVTVPRTVTPTSGPAVVLPVADPSTPPLVPATTGAPLPTTAGLTRRLTPLLAAPSFGGSVGVSVRDALTGRDLYSRQVDTPRMAASTQKMLAGAAVASTTDLGATMDTRVVRGSTPGEIVLVASGDTMLGRGRGSPTAVAGRAGLADLATQVAGALRRTGVAAVTLRLDLTYAAGPAYAPTWDMADVGAGATQGVFMTGLADQRPRIGRPSPSDPPAQVAAAFAKALTAAGVAVTVAAEKTWHTAAPRGTEVLGTVRSAPTGDVLSLALDDSDNALTENLARQAAVARGYPATFSGSTSFIVSRLKALGVGTAGVALADASGLTRSQRVPVRVISDVMTLGTTGRLPALGAAIAALPVAGLTGTLADRFDTKGTHSVAGVPRSKTGTLIGSSGMAGTTVDADGRLLSFVIVADHVPASQGTLAARAALDEAVAGLTACGCR